MLQDQADEGGLRVVRVERLLHELIADPRSTGTLRQRDGPKLTELLAQTLLSKRFGDWVTELGEQGSTAPLTHCTLWYTAIFACAAPLCFFLGWRAERDVEIVRRALGSLEPTVPLDLATAPLNSRPGQLPPNEVAAEP